MSPRNVRNRPEDVAGLLGYYRSLFPRVPGGRISMDAVPEGDALAQDVQSTLGYETVLEVTQLRVPRVTRFMMLLERIDYTAPVWFGVTALVMWAGRFLAT